MQDDNRVFEDNLERFARFCPKFNDKIRQSEYNRYTFCQTEKGEPNLSFQQEGKTLFLYENSGVGTEGEKWFEENPPIGCRFALVFGLGLGAYYDAAKEWLQGDPERILIFIEDDFAVLHRFLETDRAAKLLADPQVIVYAFDTPHEKGWGIFRQQFDWFFQAFAFKQVCFSALKFYGESRKEMMELIIKQILMSQMECEISLNDILVQHKLIVSNWYHNTAWLSDSGLMAKMYGSMKGVPAIICGAGPSIGKQVPLLKQLSDKALIIGSGTGMNVLNKNGVFPHLGVAVDPFPDQESRFMTNYAWETPYIYANRFYWPAFNSMHGPKACMMRLTMRDVPDWMERRLDLPREKWEFQGLSTSNICINVAWALGCDPIILVGMDLAYTESARYGKGAGAHPVNEPEIAEAYKRVVDKTIPVKGVDGAEILTKWEWVLEAAKVTEFSRGRPEARILNATEGGMPIYEVPNTALQKVVQEELRQEHDVEGMLHAALENGRHPSLKESDVIEALEEWKNSMKKCLKICDEILEEAGKVRQDIRENKRTVFPPMPGVDKLEEEMKAEPAYIHFLFGIDKIYPKLILTETRKITCFSDIFSPDQLALIQSEIFYHRFSFIKDHATLHVDALEESLSGFRLFQKLMDQGRKGETMNSPQPTSTEHLQGDREIRGPDDNVIANSKFVEGKKEGTTSLYYRNGAPYATLQYSAGKKDGQQLYYYPDGTNKSILHFSQGQLDGSVELFYPNGALKRILHFKEGMLDGKEQVWNAAGQMTVEAEFKKNLPCGKSRQWHPNGKLAKEIVFYDNPTNYDYFEWDEKGNLLRKKMYVPENPLRDVIDKSDELQRTISQLTDRLESIKGMVDEKKRNKK